MAASSQTLALPWYARSDYPVLLRLFSDSNKLPTTYDAWLERAEGVEQEFQSAGFEIVGRESTVLPADSCSVTTLPRGQGIRLGTLNT
jgi:hypothetical protein